MLDAQNGFKPNPGNLNYIPSLCFLFCGTYDSIHKAHSAMKGKTPLVLASGSEGLVNEILLWMEHYNAYGHDKCKNSATLQKLKKRLKRMVESEMGDKFDPRELEQCERKMIEMIEWHNDSITFIYVYDLR